jgi:hypothetical protein
MNFIMVIKLNKPTLQFLHDNLRACILTILLLSNVDEFFQGLPSAFDLYMVKS